MKCPQCNHEVPEGMAFCGNCGKSMAVKPSEEKRPRSKRGRRSWLWVLIAVPLIALVVLAVIFVPRWLGQPSQPETIAAQPTSTPPTMQVASTTAPTQPPEPLPVPEEVWLTVSGVEVQQQEAPIRIDDGYMHGATHQDDFMRFASAGDPEWAGFEALGFNEGEAVMIRFRFSDDANFVIDFRTEAWDTPDTFQWGFVQERSLQLVEHGEYIDDREFQGNLQMEPDAWYYALLAIDPQGYFLTLLWDETYQSMAFERHEYGADWRDLDWVFHLWVGSGEVDISRMDTYAITGVRISESSMDWSGNWSMMGIAGYIEDIWFTQTGGHLHGDLTNWPGEGDLSVSGTVFKWTNDAGWTFDIMRGAGLSRTPDMDPGSRPGYFYLDWWFQHSGEVISGSSNSGVNPVCLKRAGIQGYPSNCYWYYYDRLACVEATGDDLGDPQICGWYGEVKEAGLEQEAGFPEPPGG